MADIPSLKQALAASPGNVPLLLMLGEACMEAFQFEDARAAFEEVLRADPGNPAARTQIAQLLELEGRSSEAILRVEQVCSEHPAFARAWMLRAKFALGENDGRGARLFYDRAVGLDPSVSNEELLKRIRQAGGRRASTGQASAAPQRTTGDQRGGSGYDSEFEEDDFEDPFGLDDIELEFEDAPDTDYSRVGGMEAVKEAIRMRMLHPMKNPALFEAYGKRAGGGMLLYGPPGCGKTLVSRATAGEIKAKFLSVSPYQILDMWMGKSEEKMHEVFETARRNRPAVIFLDEIDAFASDRSEMRNSVGRTLVNQLLTELDNESGKNDGVLVIGATNAPWNLDPAFLRPGRFDRLVFVAPPGEPDREAIIRILAEGKPVADLDPAELARRTAGFSGADLAAMFDRAVEEALSEAMRSGRIEQVTNEQLLRAAARVRPATEAWVESARSRAGKAELGGLYEDILDHIAPPDSPDSPGRDA